MMTVNKIPMINSIWDNHKPTGEIIIKTKIAEITALNCYLASNHITGQHLFIITVKQNLAIPELKNYRFKGVEIFILENEDKNIVELYIYLIDNELKNIFSLFIQNILEQIKNSHTEGEALKTTLNVISNWKRIFDKINFNGLSIKQQKGLIGELLFLHSLLINEKPIANILNSWTSTEEDFKAKDFTLTTVGVEVKFTASKQPRIHISNETQLDAQNLSNLFLILYSSEAVKDNGISLNSLVEQIRQTISTEEERRLFNAKLQMNGYFDDDKEHYGSMYSLKRTFIFKVTYDFPRIVQSQLPLGIYDTCYSIEISALEKYMVESESLFEKLK
jgi:hypothetical protein